MADGAEKAKSSSGAEGGGARWRIGTVPYRVARPLTLGLDADPRVELIAAPPARLAALLRDGELDLALASSVLATGREPLEIWDEGPVIASDGPVRSVQLFLRPGVAPAQVKRWMADPDSRTGQALAALALREVYGAEAERVEPVMPPGHEDTPPRSGAPDPFALAERQDVDAVQLIGDPALAALRERPDWTPLDLGEAWREATGLPFVFAGWIARRGFHPADAAVPLEAAAERGLAARAELAREAAASGEPAAALGEDFWRRYLLEDVRYRLPVQQVRDSLQEFGLRLAGATR